MFSGAGVENSKLFAAQNRTRRILHDAFSCRENYTRRQPFSAVTPRTATISTRTTAYRYMQSLLIDFAAALRCRARTFYCFT